MTLRFLFGISVLLIWACSPVKETAKTPAVLAQDTLDSTEYAILIDDPFFDQWYQISYSPAKDYSNDYYRHKNWVAVTSWNEYYRTGRYGWVIDSYIEFRPEIDYGIDVNRKLFWYLRYVKEKYRIRLF
jgi:hypothetical protein